MTWALIIGSFAFLAVLIVLAVDAKHPIRDDSWYFDDEGR